MASNLGERDSDLLVFISAAEPSADLHGAGLMRAARRLRPAIRFVGVGGPAMVEAGLDRIFDMSRHSAMLLHALKATGHAARMMTVCDRCLRRYSFRAAVVIDSPTLHLPLAGRAHALGIPVLYYIAPQLWAWGASRIYKLRHRVDKLAVILPFEERYFRDQGVDAVFVGHPLAEQIEAHEPDAAVVERIRSFGSPVVALLPGSRRHVVSSVLPGQLEVAEAIAAAMPDAAFGVSVANPQVRPLVQTALTGRGLRIRSYESDRAGLIRAADLVLVASGTASLEVALHGRPMVVMYNASRLFYHLIGRWMIATRHLSLPNILAGREIVPEFMPYYRSTGPLAERAVELLRDESRREAMSAALALAVGPLRAGRASEATARLLVELAEGRHS